MLEMPFITPVPVVGYTSSQRSMTVLLKAHWLISLLLMCIGNFLLAQNKQLGPYVQGLPPNLSGTWQKQLASLSDSTARVTWLQQAVYDLHHQGYLTAQLTSYQPDTVFITRGPYYQWSQITITDLPEVWLDRLSLAELRGSPFDWGVLEQRLTPILVGHQHQGYPFAAFHRTDLQYQSLSQDTVGAEVAYQFDPGPLIIVDSIQFIGEVRESPAFMLAMTRLRKGMPFDQASLEAVPQILNNSLYFQQVLPPRVTFTPFRTAQVEIEVSPRKAGKVDLLIGFLPPPQQGDGRFEVIGSADLRLVSALRQGEVLAFSFEKLRATSQEAHIEAFWPFVLRTPLSLGAELDFVQRNNDFLNISSSWKAGYAFSPYLTGHVSFGTQGSRLLDSALIDTANLSPDQLDASRQLAGGGLRYENLDNRLSPTKGLVADLSAGVGRRRILRNNSLPEVIYEQLDLDQPVQEISIAIQAYLRLKPRQVLRLANTSYLLRVPTYLRNDQRLLGGNRNLRGFNENQFFADTYTHVVAEYRFLLERTSYLFGFAEFAYLEDHVAQQFQAPMGVGLGMTYGTKAGILSISYAVGRTNEIPFSPGRGKVHVGFVNQF